MAKKLLCINPGSTSTRISEFSGDELIWSINVAHSNDELEALGSIQDQLDYRYRYIEDELAKRNVDLSGFSAIVGRGGALHPMEGGVYSISQDMLNDCKSGRYAEHPANLGCQLALLFADKYSLPSFVVDPPLIDEFDELSRFSGLPEIKRISAFHALNEKAIAQFIAQSLQKDLSEINIVTAHLGSGISVTAQRNGRCVDNNFGSGGDGPFSPERCGRLPALSLLEAISKDDGRAALDWKKAFSKKSGLVSYIGSNDILALQKRIDDGDQYARALLDGMIHFVAKEIAAYATVLDWNVDAIGITGAIARSQYITSELTRLLEFICPVYIYPGEFEMEALAAGALRALEGKETVKTYTGEE